MRMNPEQVRRLMRHGARGRNLPGHRRGQMNTAESAYSSELEGRRLAGEIINWWFECVTFRLAGAHPLCRMSTLQDLQVGGFVQCQDHFTALPQTVDSLVIPENLDGPVNGLFIPDRRFPPAPLVDRQIRFVQDLTDGDRRNVLDHFLVRRGQRQAPLRPMRQFPICRRGG